PMVAVPGVVVWSYPPLKPLVTARVVRAYGEPVLESHAMPSRTVSIASVYVPTAGGAVYATLIDRDWPTARSVPMLVRAPWRTRARVSAQMPAQASGRTCAATLAVAPGAKSLHTRFRTPSHTTTFPAVSVQ